MQGSNFSKKAILAKMNQNLKERHSQIILFDWARANPPIAPFFFHIANEGTGNVIRGRKMKREGVVAGIPDNFLSLPNAHYHGLYIEMKRRGEKARDIQLATHERLRAAGYKVVVCYSAREAADEIKSYLPGINLTDGYFE